ncbi:cytochrome P450 [Sporobolomyces salmoneus]|uniref:cytochrome P450 n=1 Tax=Sporobolomyces salmoneus TaxID=183962 RepID=UPI0031814F00
MLDYNLSLDPTALLLYLPASIAVYSLYSFFFHPLASFPGPLGVRLGLWSFLTTRALKRDFGWELAKLHEQYGTHVRIARNQISTISPEAIDEIYRYGGNYNKSKFYSFFKVSSPSLLATLPNDVHAASRRSVSPAFAMNLLVDLEEHVDSCIDDTCAFLDEKIASSPMQKASVDMSLVTQLLAIDVVGELAFGKSFGLARTGIDKNGLIPMLDAYTTSACLSGTQPLLKPFLHWLTTRRLGAEGPQALGRAAGEAVTRRLREMEKGKEETRKDMLGKLINAKNPDGTPFTVGQVKVQANSILGAGSDTTAITMRALLYYIHRDSTILQKVQAELDEALANGTISLPLTYAAGTKLSYFQACLKETLRLHPAVPWSLPRVTPKGGGSINGTYFAEGTEISMSPYVFQRRPEAFGPDAENFRPERWIEANEEEKKRMEKNLITFGSGQRVCIGKNISLMEITKTIPPLLLKYSLSFTPRTPSSPHKLSGRGIDGEEGDEIPWNVKSQWFSHQHDFWMDVREREL